MADKVDMFMPIWIGDYLADTNHLTAEEHGAYLLLLMAAWRRGGRLPTDPAILSRMASVPRGRWDRVWASIGGFFTADGDTLVQNRLTEELTKAMGRREAAVRNGRMGAKRYSQGEQERADRNRLTRSQRLAAARAIATHTVEEWTDLIVELKGRCARCTERVDKLQKDHIVPIYQGGSDGIENIQPVCQRCNQSKGPEAKNWKEIRRSGDWETKPNAQQNAQQPRAFGSQQTPNSSPSPSPSPSLSLIRGEEDPPNPPDENLEDPANDQGSYGELNPDAAIDPLTGYGLIRVVMKAVEDVRPDLGLYNPGRWAPKAAREFIDAIPSGRRTDLVSRQ